MLVLLLLLLLLLVVVVLLLVVMVMGGSAAAAPQLFSVQSDFRSCLMCVVMIAVSLQEGGYVLFKVAVTSGLGTRDGEVARRVSIHEAASLLLKPPIGSFVDTSIHPNEFVKYVRVYS